MKRFLSLAVGVLGTLSVLAQDRIVSGTVKDKSGEAMPGVNIVIKGTSLGTSTDASGNYALNATDGVLVFSFIGHLTQEIPIGNQSKIDITLLEDVTALEEIVIIGYGTQKKKDLTSAVVVVDEDAIRDRPMVSAAEALQGKAAGVQVVQSSGKPGADISIRVRGSTSVLAGNEPLYVVDGVPTTDIRGLNPADIASMSVLKDASSSSIYGARAANGVVIITTKRGKVNEPIVRFSTYTGFSNLRKTVETLSTKQYRDLMQELGLALDPTATSYTNWNDLVFGTGTNQSYQFSVSGGAEKTQYMVSANYLQNAGIVEPARFDRYSVRVNLDNQVKKWLKIGTNLNVLRVRTKNAQDNTGGDRGGIILSVLNTPPFLGIYKKDGSGQFDPNPFQASWENPYAYMFGPEQETINNRLFGNLTAEANLLEGLVFKTNLGIDAKNQQWDYYLDPFRTSFGRSNNGYGQAERINELSWLLENTLSYSKKIQDHNFSLLAGSSVQKYGDNRSFILGSDFPENTSIKTLNAANRIVTASTTIEEWSLASFFGRLNYDYKSKYLFSGTIRRDGSSKLAHHWGTMPSFSVGWRISSEPFMESVAIINELKLRGGWGRNGNQEGISNYARYGLISYSRRAATNPLSGPAANQVTYGNPDLRWETTDQTNVGVDVSLLNARVAISADAYIKKTHDVLLNVQLGSSVGDIKTIQTNAGEIENKGIEFNISTVNTESELRWNTDFNIAFNRNEVTALQYTDVYFFGNFDNNFLPVTRVKAGLPLGSFFGYISDGVNPATGDIIYRDFNNNGIFDTRDRTVIGNAQPKFIFGLTNTLSYRQVDLNVFFQGSYGNDIYNANRIALEGMFDSKNQSTAVLRRWTSENTITDIPRASIGNFGNVQNSSRFVEDGSYIRLKSITLTYNFNSGYLKRLGVNKFSVYTTAQNLLTFTNYSGFDPEVNAFNQSATEVGIDYGTYPQSRTVTVGLNLEF